MRTTGLWKQSKKNRMPGSRWVANNEPNVDRRRRERSVFLVGTITRAWNIRVSDMLGKPAMVGGRICEMKKG